MNDALFQWDYLVITPWKLIGYLGALLFTSRWFVQMYVSRKLKRVHMPLAFWWLSITGSVLTLSYFTFGKNDSVGILNNFFPAIVSFYNLGLELRHRRRHSEVKESGAGRRPPKDRAGDSGNYY